MKRITTDFIVRKPIQKVFELIGDIASYTKWVPDNSNFFIETTITSEGGIGSGTTYIDRLRGFVTSYGEIIRYHPPFEVRLFEKKTFFGIKVFEATFSYQLKSVKSYTEIFHQANVKPCGFFGLLAPIIYMIVNSERKLMCNAIKDVLENVDMVS